MERGVTVFDASLTRGFNALLVSDNRRGEFVWPEGLERDKIDLRRVRNLEKVAGFVDHFLVDPGREYGFFAAFNPRFRLLFGYIFPRKDYAWLNIWEDLSPRQLVRAMEFANTPIHKSARELVRTPEMFGTPTFEWLGGKENLLKRFWAFSARVPENYHGVADVRWSKGELEIVERETGGAITLDFHPALR